MTKVRYLPVLNSNGQRRAVIIGHKKSGKTTLAFHLLRALTRVANRAGVMFPLQAFDQAGHHDFLEAQNEGKIQVAPGKLWPKVQILSAPVDLEQIIDRVAIVDTGQHLARQLEFAQHATLIVIAVSDSMTAKQLHNFFQVRCAGLPECRPTLVVVSYREENRRESRMWTFEIVRMYAAGLKTPAVAVLKIPLLKWLPAATARYHDTWEYAPTKASIALEKFASTAIELLCSPRPNWRETLKDDVERHEREVYKADKEERPAAPKSDEFPEEALLHMVSWVGSTRIEPLPQSPADEDRQGQFLGKQNKGRRKRFTVASFLGFEGNRLAAVA